MHLYATATPQHFHITKNCKIDPEKRRYRNESFEEPNALWRWLLRSKVELHLLVPFRMLLSP